MGTQYKYGDKVFMVGRSMRGQRPDVLGYTFIEYSLEFPGYASVSVVNPATETLYAPYTLVSVKSLYARYTQAEAAASTDKRYKPRRPKRARTNLWKNGWELPKKDYHDRDVA